MKLYHNGLSTCSQKIRLALAEKGLKYESQILNLQNGDQVDPNYLKLNPNALVPTLEDGGRIYVESSLILEYLDDAYPQPALKPADASARYAMRTLMRKIDETQHPACSVITYAIGLRPVMLQKNPEELEKLLNAVPDAARRESRRSVLKDGLQAPVFRTALHTYMDVLGETDTMLAGAEWIGGNTFSIGDCALLPYVLRLDHLGQKALIDDTLPNIARWYAAVQQRPSFKAAVTDFGPAPAAFITAGRAAEKEVRAML
jgi:glutathione S-transferase